MNRITVWTLVSAALFAGGETGAVGAIEGVQVPGDFASIQAAITGSPDGSTIVVKKGTYAEAVTISGRTGLTIVGLGKPVIDAGGGGAVALTITGSQDVSVSGLTIRRADIGISIETSARVGVTRCRIERAGTAGIRAASASNLTIERNLITDTTLRAMELGDGGPTDDSTILRNRILRAQRGIEIGGERNTIESNVVIAASRHAYETYQVLVTRDNRFVKNKSTGGQAGFRIHGARNTFTSNKVSKCSEAGVEFEDDATGNVVETTKVKGSAGDGILVLGSANTVRACKVSASGGDGVKIETDGNVVDSTSVSKSRGSAFHVTAEGSGNTFRGCRAKASGDVDLHDEAGEGANTYESTNKFATTRFGQ